MGVGLAVMVVLVVRILRSRLSAFKNIAEAFWTMVMAAFGVLALVLVAGLFSRGFLWLMATVPNDVFADMSGPKSWLVSIVLGLVGAVVGWLIFTALLGIGDEDVFDWGGILSALIGVIIVLLIANFVVRRAGAARRPAT